MGIGGSLVTSGGAINGVRAPGINGVEAESNFLILSTLTMKGVMVVAKNRCQSRLFWVKVVVLTMK